GGGRGGAGGESPGGQPGRNDPRAVRFTSARPSRGESQNGRAVSSSNRRRAVASRATSTQNNPGPGSHSLMIGVQGLVKGPTSSASIPALVGGAEVRRASGIGQGQSNRRPGGRRADGRAVLSNP